MIAIIDYGMGNLRSVQKAFQRINLPAVITCDPQEISGSERIILPGVGHFANGMEKLKEKGLDDLLSVLVLKEKKPILGICLGMQLMTNFSEEGNVPGLGWLDARTVRFAISGMLSPLKIPHMGWNNVEVKNEGPLFSGIDLSDPFYFVHSYHVQCSNPGDVLCTTNYAQTFISGFARGNIFGVQFHPEKSHTAGLKLLQNFSTI